MRFYNVRVSRSIGDANTFAPPFPAAAVLSLNVIFPITYTVVSLAYIPPILEQGQAVLHIILELLLTGTTRSWHLLATSTLVQPCGNSEDCPGCPVVWTLQEKRHKRLQRTRSRSKCCPRNIPVRLSPGVYAISIWLRGYPSFSREIRWLRCGIATTPRFCANPKSARWVKITRTG